MTSPTDTETLRDLARTLALADGFAFHLVVTPLATHLAEARRAAAQVGPGAGTVVSPYRDADGKRITAAAGWRAEVLQRLAAGGSAPPGPVWLDASPAPSPENHGQPGADDAEWAVLFRRMNEHRNSLARDVGRPLVLLCPVRLLRVFAEEAPDFWSIRSETVYVPLLLPEP